MTADDLGEHLCHQRRLPGAGHARHSRQHTERYVDGHVPQIVAGDAAQVQPAVRGARPVVEGLGAPEQIPGGGRLPDPLETGDRSAVQHAAAALARAGADVDHPVRPPDDVHVVLHDEQRVARRLEAVQYVQQRFGVGRVQAGGGFVEDVDDAEQPGAQLGGDPQALRLAGRQGRRAAPQAEISQAQIEQDVDPRDQIAAEPDRDLGRLPDRAVDVVASASDRLATGRSSATTSVSGIALISAMERPAKVTASASGRSPLPSQAGQGTLLTNRSARSRILSLLESARTCMTCLRALQNVPR